MLNMANAYSKDYLSKFKKVYNKTNNILMALKKAIKLFYEKEAIHINEEVLYFNNHLEEDPEVGSILMGQQFYALPESLIELFELANLLEWRAWSSSSKVIQDCENTLAEKGDNPRDIYLQIALLEKEIISNKIELRHSKSAYSALERFINMLHNRLVTLIFCAKNENQVMDSFSINLPIEGCIGLPLLSKMREHFYGRFDFLSQKGFFASYYASTALAYKYDVVSQYYEKYLEEDNESAEILKNLRFEIIQKAMEPCEKKMFKLGKEGATKDEAFIRFDTWASRAFLRLKTRGSSKNLLDEVKNRISKMKEDYNAWEKLSQFERKSTQANPLYELYCMKFLSTNPEKEIEAFKPSTPRNNIRPQ